MMLNAQFGPHPYFHFVRIPETLGWKRPFHQSVLFPFDRELRLSCFWNAVGAPLKVPLKTTLLGGPLSPTSSSALRSFCLRLTRASWPICARLSVCSCARPQACGAGIASQKRVGSVLWEAASSSMTTEVWMVPGPWRRAFRAWRSCS